MQTGVSGSTGVEAMATGGAVPSAVICGLSEVLTAWAGIGFVVLLIFITYTRIPVDELYHVSRGGVAGGASRVLVQLNFPVALIAVAIAGVVALRQQQAGAGTALWSAVTIIAVASCFLVAKPGVVDQGDLDATWINVVPAAGVIAILILTLLSARQHGIGTFGPFEPDDRLRLAIAIPLVLVALPWLFALAGIYIGRVPLLGHVFYSEQIPAGQSEVAVHLGDHHGASGLYFALTALLVSRVLRAADGSKLRTVLAFYLSLMLVYGIGNMANDFWTEQIWKRGWTSAQFPNLLQPALTVAWGIMIAAAVVVFANWFRRIDPVELARSQP